MSLIALLSLNILRQWSQVCIKIVGGAKLDRMLAITLLWAGAWTRDPQRSLQPEFCRYFGNYAAMSHRRSAQSCSRYCSVIPWLVTTRNNRNFPHFVAFKDLEMWGYSWKYRLFLTPTVPACHSCAKKGRWRMFTALFSRELNIVYWI